MSDSAAVSDAPMADDEGTFSLESLEEPLKSYTQQALTSSASPTSKYDTLEVQLRQHLFSSADLSKDWESCWKLCIHILTHSDLNVRKLPFVLLEDLVETLDLDRLQQFWETIHMETLCSGVLWETSTGNSHVLQWIRLQNALLKRLPNKGNILMTMAKILPLSDRSSIKLWGSVAGTSVEFEDDEDYKLEAIQGDTTPLPYSFYEIFWSLQHDMANPYAISFAKFFPSAKAVLAVMESKPLLLTTTTDDDSSCSHQVLTQKYLTRGRLLPLQLQDPAFRQSWLTQFLIVERFISSQSTTLQTTLTDLSNRAKQLLRKIPNGEPYVVKLEWILSERETMWRDWKKNKCKPDMEQSLTAEEQVQSNKRVSQPPLVPQPPRHCCLEDLALEKSMAIPNVYEHLEEYVDALDPEAGIEAEYHPKHASNFCWQTLRLLGRQHLNHFGKIRKHDGDFERMVRAIYKERNVHIPGEAPQEEEEYDHDAENEVVDEEPAPVDDVPMEEDAEEKEIAALDEAKEENNEKQAEETVNEPNPEPEKEDAASPPEPKEEEENASEEKEEASTPGEPYAGEEEAPDDEDKMDAKAEKDEFKNEAPDDAAKMDAKTEQDEAKDEALDDAAKADTETEQDQAKDEPSEPLTAFEKAAMEEEALLLAEGEERKKSQESADTKSKQEPTKQETQKSVDTKSKQEPTRGAMQEEGTSDDRKRKRSSPVTIEDTRRPRVGGNSRQGGWGGRGPPPPSHRGPPHRIGRGDGPGMRRGGPPPTRGGRGDDGRRGPRGRDTRRRY